MTREIFRAERLPVLQNRTFATEEEATASPTGDVVLVQDGFTGLIFNEAFDPSLVRYDADYQNEQARSSVFQRHLGDVAGVVERHFSGQRLIEVGCGKGYFLDRLRRLGYHVTGIDPAYEGDDPDVIRAPFERGLGLSGDGVVLRHVLEHVRDPLAFLGDITQANGGRGAIYIEVPSFEWILEHRTWFDIFYEHVNYFRLADFERMFGRVHERGHLFGGQYLFVVADLASLRRPDGGAAEPVTMPADFLSSFDRAAAVIRSRTDRRYAIWGAASKGVIFSVYLRRAGVVLDAAFDINPAKQGRFLACSGLGVSAPEKAGTRLRAGDHLFVMNSNYFQEIVELTERRYTYSTADHE